MSPKRVGFVIAIMLSFAVSVAQGEPRQGSDGRSGAQESSKKQSTGERSNGQSTRNRKPPGGVWSEFHPAGNQRRSKPSDNAAGGYAAIRNNFDNPGIYSPQWYGEHQSAWSPGDWRGAGAWARPTWKAVADQFDYDVNITPLPYNYGENVAYVGNNVVANGRPAGTAEEFSRQADELADKGGTAEMLNTDQWLPLGVFALVRNEHQHPQVVIQLAANQRGVLRGNYTDEVTDNTMPIHGAIDLKTQRAAWTVGNNKYSVMEAGLNNLTKGEASILIHKNGSTQKWLLVRLSQASQNESSK